MIQSCDCGRFENAFLSHLEGVISQSAKLSNSNFDTGAVSKMNFNLCRNHGENRGRVFWFVHACPAERLDRAYQAVGNNTGQQDSGAAN
jgi:hypothetical protein